MKKIAFISTMEGEPWGGSENLWSQTALRMTEAEAVVGVNVARWPTMPQALEELVVAGCDVTRRTSPGTPLHKVIKRIRGERCFHWLDRFRPNFAVISQGSNLDGVPWMLECLRRNIPYATVAQMAMDSYWPAQDVTAPAAIGYRNAQASFFVSQAILELTEKQIAVKLINAEVVRNPFNVDYDTSLAWPETESSMKLACVGRLAPTAKGQDLLIDVLSGAKWRARPIEIILFGNGPNRETLEKRIQMLELKNIRFGGYVNDIQQIWREHHALILPSRYEGLPLVIVEAMLCQRMCIVTDVPGNAELIRDNSTGFVAAAANARCLDEAMERAWQRRHEWAELGHEAGHDVRKVVSRDPVADFVTRLGSLLPEVN